MGYILLVGLVLAATAVAVMVGSQAISGIQADNDATAAETVLEDVDSELSTLAASDAAPVRTFDFSSDAAESLQVDRAGSLNVTLVDRNDNSCSAVSTLGTIRFEQAGRAVAYEGGGIWSGSTSGGSAMISPPDVSFHDGSLDVNLVNISGQIDGAVTDAAIDRSATRGNNSRIQSNLEACEQVDEVQLTVNSTFYRAWGNYLEEQTGVNASQVGERSMRIELTADDLPRRADMANNTVVNTTHPDDDHYMVRNDGSGFDAFDGAGSNNTIRVNKSANNSYLVEAESLSQRPPTISQVQELSAENVSNRQRSPVDVVFVMDESGSMGDEVEEGDEEKIEAAKAAADVAVGTMNTSIIGDRASIVGYTAYADQEFIDSNSQYFSNTESHVHDAIDELEAEGSTDLAAGLNQSLAALSYREDHRESHIILLTDGENAPGYSKCDDHDEWTGDRFFGECNVDYFNDRTRNAAQIADTRGVTVHTFAFGDDPNDDLLKDIKAETGGTFNASATGDELADAFESTIGGFTNRRDYATRTPLTTNLTGNGEVHPPQMLGDTDPIASNTTAGSGKSFLNINDPTAPTLFSHSFRVDEGDEVVINATKFDCAEDSWADTGDTVDTGSRTLPVARCTDIVTTNETLDGDRIEFYTDGDDMTPLMTNDDVNDTLDQYNNSSTTASNFDLASNEVIINLDFEAQGEFENNLLLRYEIGLSEADVRGSEVVNLRETSVVLG